MLFHVDNGIFFGLNSSPFSRRNFVRDLVYDPLGTRELLMFLQCITVQSGFVLQDF